MSNPLFDALQDAYKGDREQIEDTTKFKGLIAYCRRYLVGGVEVENLRPALDIMKGRCEAAADGTRNDIDAVPDLDEGVREPMETCFEGYTTIAEILGEMLEALAQNDRAAFTEGLDAFNEAYEVMAEANQALHQWMNSSDPRCPRCGSDGGAVCQRCDIERLVPDGEALLNPTVETAELGPEYRGIYDAYMAVISGDRTLKTLWPHLYGLENFFAPYVQMVNELLNSDDAVEEGKALGALLEDVFSGIEYMRRAEESRRQSDLNQGWNRIFEAAVNIQKLLPEMMEEFGVD